MPTDQGPVRFTLTQLDEWPRHQTAATFDVVANPSPHWSDGYYFTLGDHAGELMHVMGFRLYPNNDVLDAFALVSTGGAQHNLRWSRRLRPAIDDLSCGPLSVEILEGLRQLRTRCAPNPYGITFELDWLGSCPPYLEDYLVSYRGGHLVSERSNFDQTCVVTGWIEVDGRRWTVGPDGWTGVRDHSWGIGSVGGPKHPDAAPLEPSAPLGLRVWSMFAMADRSIFFQLHQNGAGVLTSFESRVISAYAATGATGGSEPVPDWSYVDVTVDPRWVADADGNPLRRLAEALVALTRPDGAVDRFCVETLSPPAYCLGGGYFNGFDDHRGRGVYRGDEHHEGEVWDVAHPTRIIDPKGMARPRNAWAETWGRITNLDDPSDMGHGHLECVVLGPFPGLGPEIDDEGGAAL